MSSPALPANRLTLKVAVDQLPFLTTAELLSWEGPFGHSRALEAIEFGIAMQGSGYNLFVMGEPGTGRLSLLRQSLEKAARTRETPGDWLYVNNFVEPREPVAICLTAGQGRAFVADIEALLDNLLVTVPAAFENPAYQRRKTRLERAFKERYDAALDRVQDRTENSGLAMFRNGDTVSFAPVKEGRAVDEAGFAELSEQEREAFYKEARRLEDWLSEVLLELPQWKRERGDRLRALAGETLEQAIEPLLHVLREKYGDSPAVILYLAELQADLCRFVTPQWLEESGHDPGEESRRREFFQRRYAPRLLVTRQAGEGAPILCEPNPTLQNVFGRIECASEQGVMMTDYHLIYAGALHQANGGYLILEADKLLADAQGWPALKRALKSRSIKIERPAPEQDVGVATLDPQVIPLSVKIALLGSRDLYYTLQSLDTEFRELFRVVAEFDEYFPRDAQSTMDFASLIKTLTEAEGLASVTAGAVARLVQFSARLAEHQDKLSACVGRITEVAFEADLFRRREGEDEITERHVQQALVAKRRRIDRVERELLAEFLDGVVLIATEGQAVGRVNALTLLEVGDSRIGSPARITATVYVGSRGVVDIEREVELGQAIHSKGVMILAGYLGQKYARRFPLAISANIALEQSYGYIDGDSAALAEVCALISALTEVPLEQAFAVTGSLNQYGDVQPVGGISEKIEGFFRLCEARMLTGRQGVVIPQGNARHLVLADEVVDASREGRFAVYAVETVDQALEILTGKPADTIHSLALAKLENFARLAYKGGRHRAP